MEAEQASAVREARQNLRVTLSISPSEVNPRNDVALRSLLISSRSGTGSRRGDRAGRRASAMGFARHRRGKGSDGEEPKGAAVELETPRWCGRYE